MTGGNYWVWPLIRYQNQQGTIRLGGGLTQTQLDAMDAGRIRGEDQLKMAATLTVDEIANTVTVTNLTGHKLITGYPEGRRMWLNIKWYDANGLIREDGKYGVLGVTFTNPVDNTLFEPQSILDLHDANTKIYEVHPAMTQEWAQTLMVVDAAYYGPIDLGYNRITGAAVGNIADLSSGNLGPYAKTFHFALNNHIADDNRIPPYRMDYEEARKRNALPVPDNQYGDPGPGGEYNHRDEVKLTPPPSAVYAEITLYYQGTSWEYVQFLWLANKKENAFLEMEGEYMLDAWLNADPANPMVPPFAMATATWGAPPSNICTPEPEGPLGTCSDLVDNDCDTLIDTADPDCTPQGVNCSSYTTRNLCNAQNVCRWDNKAKSCIDRP